LPEVPIGAELRHNTVLAVKEALTNALKHSGAQTVWLRLQWRDPHLRITVEDDGKGFAADRKNADGNGLRNQASRMKDIGGSVEIQTSPGRGTQVVFSIDMLQAGI
jgi:signal transduction histidine kinase